MCWLVRGCSAYVYPCGSFPTGKVTLNGEAFESRRRLSATEKRFGYLNAAHFEVGIFTATSEFVVPIDERFASVEHAFQFDKDHAAFRASSGSDEHQSGHVKLSFSLDSIRLNTRGERNLSVSKLR